MTPFPRTGQEQIQGDKDLTRASQLIPASNSVKESVSANKEQLLVCIRHKVWGKQKTILINVEFVKKIVQQGIKSRIVIKLHPYQQINSIQCNRIEYKIVNKI
jgi:hypothetical protein